MLIGRRSASWCAAVLLFSCFSSPAPTGTAVVLSPSVALGWNPSPDSSVVGYLVLFGAASGVYTNQLDAGGATSATIRGLRLNVTYYFVVVGYNSRGEQSPPSNEIAYLVPAASLSPAEPRLSLQATGAANAGAALRVSFQAAAAMRYQLQATQDFLHWHTVGRTNCRSAGWVVFCITDMPLRPKCFYRLKCIPKVAPSS